MDFRRIFHGFPHLSGPGDLLIPRLGRRLGRGRRARELRAAAGAALRGGGGHLERRGGGEGGQHGDLDPEGFMGLVGKLTVKNPCLMLKNQANGDPPFNGGIIQI